METLEQLSEEDAVAALSGYTRRDLLNAWGEPQSTMAAFSSLHVDLYDAPTRGGWFGNHHFSRCNKYLKQHNITPINW